MRAADAAPRAVGVEPSGRRCAAAACLTHPGGAHEVCAPRSHHARPARGHSSSTSGGSCRISGRTAGWPAVAGSGRLDRGDGRLLAPWPLAILIDSVLGDKPLPDRCSAARRARTYELLALAVVAGLLITGVEHGVAVLDNYVNTRLDQEMVLDLRSDMFRARPAALARLPRPHRTGQLMFEINNQASAVGAVTVAVPPLLQSVFTLVGMFVILVPDRADARAAVADGRARSSTCSAGYYAKRIQPRVDDVRHLESKSLTIVHEAMAMMRVIVAFGREEYEYRRFRAQGEQAVRGARRLTVRQTLFSLVVTMTTAVGSALVLGFGAVSRAAGRPQPSASCWSCMGYIAALYKPLEQISNTVSALQEQFITLRVGASTCSTPSRRSTSARTRVELERAPRRTSRSSGVSFSYAGRRGTLARRLASTVGRDARSRSSARPAPARARCLSLLPRFYDPQRGRVLLDGHDVRDLHARVAARAGQRRAAGAAAVLRHDRGQHPLRRPRGERRRGDRRPRSAANAARLHRPRCRTATARCSASAARGCPAASASASAVARAFLKDAPILILDEPTSSIDSRTEAVILDALERLMEGRTTFIVAHRLSTDPRAPT